MKSGGFAVASQSLKGAGLQVKHRAQGDIFCPAKTQMPRCFEFEAVVTFHTTSSVAKMLIDCIVVWALLSSESLFFLHLG